MATPDMLSYYAGQGEVTDAREHTRLFDAVPRDIAGLCRLAQGLVIHAGWARAYGIAPTDARLQALSSRSVAAQLRDIRTMDDRPLGVPRPVSSRLLGSCRDFALLICAVLRHHGVPARVRCGFATYLGPNRYEDHWVCEHWMQGQNRWSIVDAQIDAVQRGHLNVAFDTTDVPRDRFLTAGQVWRMCRAGEATPADCGNAAATGLWLVRVNVVRDLLALTKTEISPWDSWRHISPANRALDDETIAACDKLAGMTFDADRRGEPVMPSPALMGTPIPPSWVAGSLNPPPRPPRPSDGRGGASAAAAP